MRCSEISAARSRAAATVNIARSSLALKLRAFLGPAKTCAPVKLFITRPTNAHPAMFKFNPWFAAFSWPEGQFGGRLALGNRLGVGRRFGLVIQDRDFA